MKLLNLTVNPSGSINLSLNTVDPKEFFLVIHAKESEDGLTSYNNIESTLIVKNSEDLTRELNEMLPAIEKGATLGSLSQSHINDLIKDCFSSFIHSYRIGNYKPKGRTHCEAKRLRYGRNLSTYDKNQKCKEAAIALNKSVGEKQGRFLNERFYELEQAIQSFISRFNEYISDHYKSLIEDRRYQPEKVEKAMTPEQKKQLSEITERGAVLNAKLKALKAEILANEQAKFEIEKAVIIEQIKPEDPSADPVLAQVLEEIKEIQIKNKKSFF